jgi:hypothetical protein
MSLDDVLKLLFFVPLPLRRPTALATVAMLALAGLLTFARGFGYWDAIWDPIWLYTLTLCCVCLVALAVSRRRRLRNVLVVLWGAVFAIIAVAAAIEGHARNAYVYNPLGFLQSRTWTRESGSSGNVAQLSWKWQLIAVQDLGEKPLLVELRKTDGCDFERFWPTSESSKYTPAITDVTEGTMARRWQLENFRKPANLTFHLVTGGQSGPPARCQPQISIGDGK